MAEYSVPLKVFRPARTRSGVTLRVHQRSDLEGAPIWEFSWRDQTPGGKNRRFYSSQAGYWTVPIEVARSLLEQAESEGFFNPPYLGGPFAPRAIQIIDGFDVPGSADVWREVTCEGDAREADWGPTPFFVVGEQATHHRYGHWRKIMLVDTLRRQVTFRSTTTMSDYGQKITMNNGNIWWLDNAMQDASGEALRAFLFGLRVC